MRPCGLASCCVVMIPLSTPGAVTAVAEAMAVKSGSAPSEADLCWVISGTVH